MPRVNYTAPSTVDEAVKILAATAGEARPLSGGTDLLVQLKSGRSKPEMIVDTKHIPGLIGIREEGDFFVIGAATPGVVISADKRLEHAYPGIVEEKLARPEAEMALAEAAGIAQAAPSCLLCYEADWRGCHRRRVAEILSARHGFAIRHLAVSPEH